MAKGFDSTLFDMSVGYDLKGVRSPRVRAFVAGMKDARAVVERLRAQLPPEAARWRDLPFTTRVSDTVTLSTFHGCPPGEIADIADFLMSEEGLGVVVKLNPTLLGPTELRALLHDALGYKDVVVPDEAFEKDARWDDVVSLVGRLERKAASLGVGFGVKFCNTLVVENRAGFLPASEKTSYLSGAPLHVLAMHLVKRFRDRFGEKLPVSFSGGIDKTNFPDAVSVGLAPVTVCSDLLRPGGYGRLRGCLDELGKRMDAVQAIDVPSFMRKSPGVAAYVSAATADPRYARPKNAAVPRKVGSELAFFDCLTCDKCLSVCPNGANFAYEPAAGEAPPEGTLKKRRQFANFADFCNDCGNCDVFCPEDGGPQLRKPRFFGSLELWKSDGRDGFFLERADGAETVHGRIAGREYRLRVTGAAVERSGAATDGAPFALMDFLRKAVLDSPKANYING
ncbi:hypothetical protein EPO15_08040 [bacterium]|nr:MAG: hypothetical protein EPO15_08040 [bacterium]